jgi:hypothetical protein
MERVGARVSPVEFVDAVIRAFRCVEPLADSVVYGRFRRSRAWSDFVALLLHAGLRLGARVLCVGCGEALAGRSSVYASAVVLENYPWAEPDLFDIDPGGWNFDAGPYECIVSHSLLHFVYDPFPVCESIYRLVAPGGVYIMANEPNARFWSNGACLQELHRVDREEARRRRWRRYAEPARYLSRLIRAIAPEPKPGAVAGINRMLRERLRLRGDLTFKEIVRIADPHQPDRNPGEFAYGTNGLDWTNLSAGFQLESVRTSGYVMRDNPMRVPARWCETDARMAARFPLDGCSFSALWRK